MRKRWLTRRLLQQSKDRRWRFCEYVDESTWRRFYGGEKLLRQESGRSQNMQTWPLAPYIDGGVYALGTCHVRGDSV